MPYGSVLTDTVQSSTAGTPPQFNDGNGTQVGTLCRAWVNFSGTTRNGSFNVSSVTKNGTGDYTITFTNAMSDANYSVVTATQENRTCGIAYGFTASPLTTTTARVATALTNGSYTQSDPTGVCVSIFR